MVEAYVLIECEHGKALSICEDVAKIPGVISSKAVTGPYDVICCVAASNSRELGDVVIKKIQGLIGVRRTITNVIIE